MHLSFKANKLLNLLSTSDLCKYGRIKTLYCTLNVEVQVVNTVNPNIGIDRFGKTVQTQMEKSSLQILLEPKESLLSKSPFRENILHLINP